jgi:Cu+-exporting ATPase
MLGRYLEIAAKGKTSNTLSKLVELQAQSAILLTPNTGSNEIDINLVQRGDILKVLPGSKIPTDGIIVFGITTIDESMVTGESTPVLKTIRSSVYGGTVNQQGTIHVQVTRTVAESTVSAITKLVEDAQASKAPIQRIADVISSYFVQTIIALAVAAFIIWMSVASTGSVTTDLAPLPFALQFFIAVLIISCPCAIGLAVPTAIMVGTGVGAKLGILLKGGSVVEACHKVTTIIFDKTGTLTQGTLVVVRHKVFEDKYADTFLLLAGSAETGSEHVIGKAIVKYTEEEGKCKLKQPRNFEAVPGKGLQCKVSKKTIIIGNKQWLHENGTVSKFLSY